MYAANQQWLNKAEKVVKMASPKHKKSRNDNTPSPSKITTHFKSSKLTPPSVTNTDTSPKDPSKSNKRAFINLLSNQKTQNPYKNVDIGGNKTPSITEAIAMKTTSDLQDKDKSTKE